MQNHKDTHPLCITAAEKCDRGRKKRGRGRKRGSCVVSLCVKRLAVLQSPLSEQVLTTWLPPSLPLPLPLSLSLLPLSQIVSWSAPLWPFTLIDRWDYYLPNTHSANTRQHSYHAVLTVHPPNHTHTHTHTYTYTEIHTCTHIYAVLMASSSPSLPCGQTKEATLCIILILLSK